MKNPFDTIVGPDGVWKDEAAEAVNDFGLTAREDFARRCLNAAANLYGILTPDEFVSLYNGYAKGHEPAVARPMTTGELDGLVGRLIEVCTWDDEEPDSPDEIPDRPECWFDFWDYKQTGRRLIVQDQFTELGSDGTPMTTEECEKRVRRQADGLISETLKEFAKVDLKALPEADFLEYEEPTYSEETGETKKFEKFLVREYDLPEDLAGIDIWGIQGEVRCNVVSVTTALEYIRDCCEWRPEDEAAVERLIREISPVVGVTRTWAYRGHTEKEMCQLGLIDRYEREDIPDVFGMLDDGEEADDDSFYLDDLPKPVYTGPIDFKFVKDPVRREAKMEVYENVRQIMDEFGEKYLVQEFKSQRMADAAVRLGCLKRGESVDSLPRDQFLNVADFVTTMDDANDGPAIKRLAKKKGKMDGFERLALEYYSSARYTWLLIEALKTGYGMKCRDLLTGEELFLIDRSSSLIADAKGRTLCIGIAPMEDVYLVTGTGTLVYLKDPESELNTVLSRIGVLNVRPVRLSFHDQARFVEETARHLKTLWPQA